MAELRAPLRATVHGFVRGHDIDGDAVITFERESLLLQSGRVRVALLLRSLDGWTVGGDALHIHADGGDFVSMVTTDVGAVARQFDDWAFQLPELTRSLRVFGSRRAAGGERRAEHDAFFAPLLAARGEAARASTPEGRRSALDARKLRNEIRLRLRAYAAERYPTDAPERRALEAELDESAAPLMARLAELAAAEERLSASTAEQRLLHWREWAQVLAALFESADRCWPEIGATLSDDRRESPSRWRRFGRGRRTRPGL